MIETVIENLFRINLGIKKEERLLVFTDDERQETGEIGHLFAKAGERFAKNVAYIEFRSTGCHGIEPPRVIWEKAFGKDTGYWNLLLIKK